MATKSNPVDQIGNTWAGYAARAAAGEFRFDPQIAATVAGAIIGLLEQVTNVKNLASGGQPGFYLKPGSFGLLAHEAGDWKLGDYGGTEPSPGEQVRAIYNTLWKDILHPSADSHTKVLNEMLDTYLNIGKVYKGADNASAAIFDKITKRQAAVQNSSPTTPPADAVTLDVNAPYQGLTQDPPAGHMSNSHAYADRMDHPVIAAATQNRPTYYGGKSDNKAVTPLDISQLGYRDLYYLGHCMDPDAVRSAAGFWWQMAGQLRAQRDSFMGLFTSNGGHNAVTSAWVGAGCSAAVKSMSAYGAQFDEFTGGMYGAHDMLMHAAAWMNQVKPQLPQDPNPPANSDSGPDGVSGAELQALSSDGDTRPYVEPYQNIYAPNVISDPSSYVPQIPAAAPVTTAAVKDTGPGPGPLGSSNNGDANSGDAGGGFGSGLTRIGRPVVTDLQPYTGTLPVESLNTGQNSNDIPVTATPILSSDPTGSGKDLLSQAQNVLGQAQNGSSQAQNASSQLQNPLNDAKNAVGQMSPASVNPSAASGLHDLAKSLKVPLGGLKAGGLAGGGGGGLPGSELAKEAAQEAKLFPRALAALEQSGPAAQAGVAQQGGLSGYPGGMGGMGGAKPGESKEHKRAEYLSSKRHLEEAFGKPPSVSKPIVEQ